LLLFVALSGRGHWRDLLERPAAAQGGESVPTSSPSEPRSVDAPEKTEKTPDSAFSVPSDSIKIRQNASSLLANVASRRQNKEARFLGVRPLGVAPFALSVSSFPFSFVDAAPSFVKESFSR
jgi:hypothetical protein